MRRAEGVVGGFAAFGEARQPVLHPQAANTVAAFSEDFMRVALVADIPDDLVARGVKDRMQRHGQLYHAKPGAQVSAGFRHGRDRLGPQFTRDLGQFGIGQAFQVRRAGDLIKQGGGGFVTHRGLSGAALAHVPPG